MSGRGDTLHHDDGTHRVTARTANGRDVARHEAALRAHTADGHTHEAPPEQVAAAAAALRAAQAAHVDAWTVESARALRAAERAWLDVLGVPRWDHT